MLISSYAMQARLGISSQDDMPTLKHFFPCTETTGDIMTDTQSGLVWSPNDEIGPPKTGITINGSAGNTIGIPELSATNDFDGYEVGDQFTVSGGSGDTGIRGTYTVATRVNDKTVTVNEPVITGSLTLGSYQRITARGQMQFASGINAVYPAMPDSNNKGLGDTGKRASPVDFREGIFSTIPEGKSFLVMYAARVMTEVTPTDYDAGFARLAFGDINDIRGQGGGFGLGLAGGDYHCSVKDDGGGTLHVEETGVNFDSTNTGKDVVNYLKCEPGIIPELKCIDLADYSTLYEDNGLAGDTSNLAPTYDPVDITLGADYNYVRCSGLAFYGIAIYIVNTMPDDIDEAIKWNGWAWKNNYRIPYPGAVSWT